MTLDIGAPQLVYLAMMAVGVGVSLAKYGQQKQDRYDIFDVLVGPAVGLTILWWGGFFG